MIRQLLLAVALTSVTVTAAAALARSPGTRLPGHSAHRLWTPIMQRLADNDHNDAKRKPHHGVTTGVRAANGLGDALPFDLHAKARPSLLAAGQPQRWTF